MMGGGCSSDELRESGGKSYMIWNVRLTMNEEKMSYVYLDSTGQRTDTGQTISQALPGCC
jgi:hypothetical protein